MTRPESNESTIEISQIEKSFPAPPKSSQSNRKTLPQLPSLAEIQDTGLIANTSEDGLTSPASTLRTWTPASSGSGEELPMPFGITMKATRPPRPISKDPPRPMTASTKRLSFSSVEPQRRLKYGNGKYANVELSPQPSEDPEDPLNWAMWKKELNFYSLLLMVALVGVMKTAFISVNSFIATEDNVSYTSAVALTAVPLMLSAVTGMLSAIVARIWGKRPVYLVSTLFIFIGAAVDTMARSRFGQNMAGRVFQGLGWGAFDTLVLGSIQDMYFDHERQQKIMIHYVVSIATTWGSPLLGGVASLGAGGFELQFDIIVSFLAVAIPLLVLGSPETAYHRSAFSAETPTDSHAQALRPSRGLSKDSIVEYMGQVRFQTYKPRMVNSALILQAPKAAVAPTTLMLFIVTLLPHAALWGLASSLSLLFTPLPFMLSEASLGAIMAGPFILATAFAAASLLPLYTERFARVRHLATIAAGTLLAVTGIFGFGFYIQGCMTLPTDGSAKATSTLWDLGFVGDRLSFPAVSVLLGLLAAGSVALDAAVRPMVQRSTSFTSANVAVGLRNGADMTAGLTCLRSLAAGAFVLGVPNAVWAWDGLKAAVLGMGVTQLFIAAAAGAVWWYWEENVRRLDGSSINWSGHDIWQDSANKIVMGVEYDRHLPSLK
ncbi:hypothetical protein F5Y15DRAFT_415880 [Xylariaceae sp. FL0016]|nr:hypothetical protein F5Y15DRAFT_415880 [Xylariaceae sp. FL0016]